MTEHVGAAPYERTTEPHRPPQRPQAAHAQDAGGHPEPARPPGPGGHLLDRAVRALPTKREGTGVWRLMEMYVQGVSTRKVKEITEELCGTSFSKSQVSALAGRLDAELEAWRSRPLEAEAYPYLVVDARYEHVRVDGRVVSQGVLVVSAVRAPDGLREILGGRGGRHRERGDLPGALPRAEGARAAGRRARHHRRPRGAAGGHRAPLPGGVLAALPGPLRQEPARHGRPRHAQGPRRRPARRSSRRRAGNRPCGSPPSWPDRWRPTATRRSPST